MKRNESYVQRTEEFLTRLQKTMDFEIVDVEFVKEAGEYYLRVYCDMDQEGGIGLEDCANISRALSDWLDQEDFIGESYILEVSSPGLGRPLKKDKDLQREMGSLVDIKLFQAMEWGKEFQALLKGFDKEQIVVEIEDKEISLPRKQIAGIKLSIDF